MFWQYNLMHKKRMKKGASGRMLYSVFGLINEVRFPSRVLPRATINLAPFHTVLAVAAHALSAILHLHGRAHRP